MRKTIKIVIFYNIFLQRYKHLCVDVFANSIIVIKSLSLGYNGKDIERNESKGDTCSLDLVYFTVINLPWLWFFYYYH